MFSARLLLGALLLSAAPLAADDAEKLAQAVGKLTEVVATLQDRLAQPFDVSRALYEGAIPALVRNLDPHSSFLDPGQYESLKEMQRSTEKGFGSVVSITPGRVVLLQTLPESPSAKAGLSPGDEIAVINGYPLTQLGVDQLVQLLSQSRQQPAELMVRRPNFARLIPITLTPAELDDPSVRLSFHVGEGIGYIKIANFESGTAREANEAIQKLGGEGLKGLVLDMRGNPGGVVESAVQLAAMFLESGQRILWIQGREGPQDEVRVPVGNKSYRFPMAVLIDDRTGSAAELVTAALQDHDRATIIGERSYGKGLVQSVFELSEGAGLALTTAFYLSPSGRPIQRAFQGCHDYQLEECESDNEKSKTYPTDSGRQIPGGGGIEPDRVVRPRQLLPFEAWLKGANAFLDFAQTYIREHQGIDESFVVTPDVLDEFQLFLSERGVRPNLSVWTSSVDYIRRSLQQEILNLGVSVDKGDEVELRHDSVVLEAVSAIEGAKLEARAEF